MTCRGSSKRFSFAATYRNLLVLLSWLFDACLPTQKWKSRAQLPEGYTHAISSTSGIPSRLITLLFVCFYIRQVVKHQPQERNSLRCPARFSSLFPNFYRRWQLYRLVLKSHLTFSCPDFPRQYQNTCGCTTALSIKHL